MDNASIRVARFLSNSPEHYEAVKGLAADCETFDELAKSLKDHAFMLLDREAANRKFGLTAELATHAFQQVNWCEVAGTFKDLLPDDWWIAKNEQKVRK